MPRNYEPVIESEYVLSIKNVSRETFAVCQHLLVSDKNHTSIEMTRGTQK